MRDQREHRIYELIADHMATNHPGVVYRFDLAADLKLTLGQAKKHRRIQRFRGYPDLFIASPNWKTKDGKGTHYCGLYIEIKKEGTRIFRRDGRLVADEHIREQFDMLQNLQQVGYKATFGIGLEECLKIIDEYLA